MDPDDIKALIEAGLPGAAVRVQSEDNIHFEAVVVADAFEDRNRISRHQLVYSCLGERMGKEIHALSIRAYTNGEWQAHEDG